MAERSSLRPGVVGTARPAASSPLIRAVNRSFSPIPLPCSPSVVNSALSISVLKAREMSVDEGPAVEGALENPKEYREIPLFDLGPSQSQEIGPSAIQPVN